jgi:hypothetical protein
LCHVHERIKLGKKTKWGNEASRRLPTSTKTGRFTVLGLSEEKREKLIGDLLNGDLALDLDAETQVARYISASVLMYLQAHEDQPFEKRERSIITLLNSLATTARIVSMNAELKRAESPLQSALTDAIRMLQSSVAKDGAAEEPEEEVLDVSYEIE